MYLRLNEAYQLKCDKVSIYLEPKITNESRENNFLCFEINESMFEFLKRCDGKATFEQIINKLAIYYDCGIARLAADFLPILESLIKMKIIKGKSSSSYQQVQIVEKLNEIIPLMISLEVTNNLSDYQYCVNLNEESSTSYIDIRKLEDFIKTIEHMSIQAVSLTGEQLLDHPQLKELLKIVSESFNHIRIAIEAHKQLNREILESIRNYNIKIDAKLKRAIANESELQMNEKYEKAYQNIIGLVAREIETHIVYMTEDLSRENLENEVLKARAVGASSFMIKTSNKQQDQNGLRQFKLGDVSINANEYIQNKQDYDFVISTDCHLTNLKTSNDDSRIESKVDGKIVYYDIRLKQIKECRENDITSL